MMVRNQVLLVVTFLATTQAISLASSLQQPTTTTTTTKTTTTTTTDGGDPTTPSATKTQRVPNQYHLARLTHQCPNSEPTFVYPATAGEGVTVFVVDGGPARCPHQEFTTKEAGTCTRGWIPNGWANYDPAQNGLFQYHASHVAGIVAGHTVGIAKKASIVTVGAIGPCALNPDITPDNDYLWSNPGGFTKSGESREGGSCGFRTHAFNWVLSEVLERKKTHPKGNFIISASLQPKNGLMWDDNFQKVLNDLRDADVPVFVSAGNGNNIDSCKDGYCKYDNVFCVGMTSVATKGAINVPSNEGQPPEAITVPVSPAYPVQPTEDVFDLYNMTYDPPDAMEKYMQSTKIDTVIIGDQGFATYNGACNDIFATGRNIVSISNAANDLYCYGSGTSQATPVVAGTAALVWGEHPTWTSLQVEDYLRKAGISNVISGSAAVSFRQPIAEPGTPPFPDDCVCWSIDPVMPTCNLAEADKELGYDASEPYDAGRRYVRPCSPFLHAHPNLLLNIASLSNSDGGRIAPVQSCEENE